jgi:RNA polymerase sigma-70 factor (ECF subfamily)
MSTAAEQELRLADVTSAAAGNEIAFTRIVEAHDDDMARVAYLVCGDVMLAHEAVQAAWLIAWRKLRNLRDPDRLRAWLVSIAANEARQLLRQRRRRSVVEIPASDIDKEAGPRSAPGAHDDSKLDLLNALRLLSPEDRAIVAMRYALGMTSDEIGRATSLSAPGVRSRLARAIGRLRKELDGV